MLGNGFKQRSKLQERRRQNKMKEETPTMYCSKKGLMDKKQRKKNGILKGKKKGKPGEKTEKEEKKHFKTGLLGE